MASTAACRSTRSSSGIWSGWPPATRSSRTGTVVSADGLALDEAHLTGESESVVRGPGEPVWSGSFVVEGTALFEATAVGPDSRAERLTATARAFRHPRSPLERANDQLLLWLIALSVPVAIGLDLVGPRSRRVRQRPGAGRDRRDRQPRPGGADPADQRHGCGVGIQDGAARRTGAAAQRDRVARVGRHRLHRQDGYAHRADAASRRAGACRLRGRDLAGAWSWPVMPPAPPPAI